MQRHTSLKRYALPTHIKVPYVASLSRFFLEMKSVEVAEQITLIDFEMLKNIQVKIPALLISIILFIQLKSI